jgi:hypothetical protein
MPTRSGSDPWGSFTSSITNKTYLNGTMTLTAPGSVSYALNNPSLGSVAVSNANVSTVNNTISFTLAYTPTGGTTTNYTFSGTWNAHAGGGNNNPGYAGKCSGGAEAGDDDWAAPTN